MSINWERIIPACVDFTQRLIRTPSMPHEEAAIAQVVVDELQRLGYDEVWQDEIGNVYGRVHGRDRSLPALVLNTHLDHVDPGDPALWPAPPFGGVIQDGCIIGRGACDIKGPLAAQVYSLGALLSAGERPRRDVVFCGVVQEEIGGAGAIYWIENLDYPVELVILGEPSSNDIALGHRGIVQMWVTFHGRSVHASIPDEGDNPNYAMANFLTRLRDSASELSRHPVLGPTSVSPTIVEVDTTSKNVIPAWTRVLLDFRTASESLAGLQVFINRLAGDYKHTLTLAEGMDYLNSFKTDEAVTGFYTPPDSPLAQRAQVLIGEGMGHVPQLIRYRFATDGRHFASRGVPVIGFAPGDAKLAHTAGEYIRIDELADSLRGHVQLLREF